MLGESHQGITLLDRLVVEGGMAEGLAMDLEDMVMDQAMGRQVMGLAMGAGDRLQGEMGGMGVMVEILGMEMTLEITEPYSALLE